MTQIASLRAAELEPDRIIRHIRHVEADFAEAVAEHLRRQRSDDPLRTAVTARCVAAATFGAMELWMTSEERSLAELASMCQTALGWLDGELFRQY